MGEIQPHYSHEWKQTFTVPANRGCSLTNRNKWQFFSQLSHLLFWKCFLGKLKVKSSLDWCIFGIYNRKTMSGTNPLHHHWWFISLHLNHTKIMGSVLLQVHLLLTPFSSPIKSSGTGAHSVGRAPELASVRRRGCLIPLITTIFFVFI